MDGSIGVVNLGQTREIEDEEPLLPPLPSSVMPVMVAARGVGRALMEKDNRCSPIVLNSFGSCWRFRDCFVCWQTRGVTVGSKVKKVNGETVTSLTYQETLERIKVSGPPATSEQTLAPRELPRSVKCLLESRAKLAVLGEASCGSPKASVWLPWEIFTQR